MRQILPGFIVILVATAIFFGCTSEPQIKAGDTVKLKYTARDGDGSYLDSSLANEPLELTLGQGQIFPSLENKLIGLKIGDTANIILPPESAFGPIRPDLMGRLPKGNFPDTFALEIGRSFSINTPNGPLFAVIKGIEEDSVLVDVNHPMAGKTLIYDVKVLEIMSSDTAKNK